MTDTAKRTIKVRVTLTVEIDLDAWRRLTATRTATPSATTWRYTVVAHVNDGGMVAEGIVSNVTLADAR